MDTVKSIFSEFEIHKKEIEIPIHHMKKDLEEYTGKIVLYGAGSAGIAFFHYLKDVGINPVFFADGDTEKQGKMCEGLEIISPSEIILRLGKNALVIVTINTDGKNYCKDFKKELLTGGHQGVHQRLKECGCINVIDYTYFRRCYALFQGEKYNLPSCTDVYLMKEHQHEIESVYHMLEDDMSRQVFLKLLEFRLLTDKTDIPTLPEENMYFEYTLFEKKKDEVFVDCGACSGSSLKGFLNANDCQFEKYVGIEPDIRNFKLLEHYISGMEDKIQNKMKIFHAAAYEHNEGTNFYVLKGPGTFQAAGGPDFVKTIRIDDALPEGYASYIKMNIESSEVPALKGAEHIIKRFAPRLAIMGYHKTSDFWAVPLLMKQFNQEYKLSLRSYMHNVAFTYYAY